MNRKTKMRVLTVFTRVFDRKLGAGLVRRLEELDAQEAIEKMKEDGGK